MIFARRLIRCETSCSSHGASKPPVLRICIQTKRVATMASAAIAACWGLAVASRADETCATDAGSSHDVVRVIDSETVLLDDGREVRLIGALAPKADAIAMPDAWPPEREALRALETLVSGRAVTLRYEGRKRDRYGRELAQLYVAGVSGPEWVQRRLIADGHARAYALPGNSGCLRALLGAEEEPRTAQRGLWSRTTYRVREASEVDALLRLAGRFVLVSGRVSQVARTQRTTYINFGSDWRRDFTASIASSLVDRSPDGATRLSALAGKEIRVRGWIERRNGPMIVLGSFDEIETLNGNEGVPPPGSKAAADTKSATPPPDTTTPR